MLGHWPLLVGYAVLPWLVLAAREWRTTGVLPWRAVVAGAAGLAERQRRAGVRRRAGGASRPSGASAAGRRRRPCSPRRRAVAGLRAAARGRRHHRPGRREGLCAAHGRGTAGACRSPRPWWHLEGRGGPGARDGLLGWLSVLAVLGLAAAGLRGCAPTWARRDRSPSSGAVVLAGLAVLTLGRTVGDGLDGLARAGGRSAPRRPRILASAPRGLALAAARCGPVHGCAPARGAGGSRDAGLAWAWPWCCCRWRCCRTSASGCLRTARRSRLPRRVRPGPRGGPAVGRGASGDVVLLPFSSYRQPVWNGGRKVLDPMGRFLTPRLPGRRRPAGLRRTDRGGGPASPRRRSRPGPSTPEARSRGLAALGIRFAVTDLRRGRRPGSPAAHSCRRPGGYRCRSWQASGCGACRPGGGWRWRWHGRRTCAMLGVARLRGGVRRITASRLRGGGRSLVDCYSYRRDEGGSSAWVHRF